MFSPESYPLGALNRYSARKSVKPINFLYFSPDAKVVSLIGDFNDWHPNAHPMKRMPDGGWHIQVPVSSGHHHYLFLVDGKPTLDPRAQGTAPSDHYTKVSLLAVS